MPLCPPRSPRQKARRSEPAAAARLCAAERSPCTTGNLGHWKAVIRLPHSQGEKLPVRWLSKPMLSQAAHFAIKADSPT